MKWSLAVVCVCAALAGGASKIWADESLEISAEVLAAQSKRIEVMRTAAAATVSIFGLDGGGGGSGVLISPDGYALTNYHVSSACGDHMRCGLNDGQMYDAVIVGVDAVGDVSLIKLLGREDFPTAPMADSSLVRAGQWCFSAGNPFGLAANRQPSVSLGLVSGTNRYQYPAGTILEYADCLQTDAAVNPGNSGGPLFNLAGEVIGINGRCSFEKRGRVNVGVGYAISSNQIKMFLGMLHSGRLLDHATLGATVATDDSGQVVVSNILSSSDAYRRGLRYGDQVIRFADRDVGTTNAFKNVLGTLPKDLRVPIEIRRDGELQTLLVRLVGVHTADQLNKIVEMGLDGEPKGHSPDPPDDPPLPAKPDEEPSEKTLPESGPDELLPGMPNFKLVNSMLEARPGFANYYFNRAWREQFAKQLPKLGNYLEVQEIRVKGKLVGESTRCDVRVSADAMDVTLGSRRNQYTGDLSDIVAQRRQGAVAVALKAWLELLKRGPDQIGESTYLGKLPVYRGLSMTLAEQPWHDVMETLWYDARVRYSWDQEYQQVSLIEVFGDDGTDPAELYLDQYRKFDLSNGQYEFPARMRLQFGTEIVLAMEVEEFDVVSAVSASNSSDAGSSAPGSSNPGQPGETPSGEGGN